jgi:DNA polymerase-1
MSLPVDLQLNLVETFDDARAYLDWLERCNAPVLGCDTETGGLSGWWREPLRMVQFGDAMTGWAIPWHLWPGLVHETFKRWPRDFVLHNAKFDVEFLEHRQIEVPRHRIHDSLLLARAVAPHMSAALKTTADRLVDSRAGGMGRALDVAMMKGKWTWRTVPWNMDLYWTYAALDPVLTVRIWDELLKDPAAHSHWSAYQIDLAVQMTVMDMEQRGIGDDMEYCSDWAIKLEAYEERVRDWATRTYGIHNIGSDAELVSFFQRAGFHLTQTTDKGNLSMDKNVLASLYPHPLAVAVAQYRKANKRRTTYFEPWMDFSYEDRIHPNFNISGARTARMSSDNPNLQNVPRSRMVRRGLVAKPNHVLVLADYDQIELRLMAHFADSKPMIDAIHAGEDLHTYTAKLVYRTNDPTKEQRRIAKHSNFAKIYGAGIGKFAWTAGITFEEAREFLTRYDQEFPEVRQFQQRVSTAAYQSAAQSEDKLAHLTSSFVGRQQVAAPSEAYKLVNYIVQGTAADVLKVKMLDIDRSDYGSAMTIPIHDEIAYEVHENDAEEFARGLPEVMEDRDSFKVPLSVGVEIVRNWGDKYEEGT